MRLISDVTEMRRLCQSIMAERGALALVPTMGALHAGHLELVDRASRGNLPTVVSIFVNPSQFGPDEDYALYPRNLDSDLAALTGFDTVEAVFAPTVSDMYPVGVDGQLTEVAVRDLPDQLCGAFRPGHFNGVTTVVAKLFNICSPTVAFFGKKDAQQFVIIRRMVSELNIGVEIIGVDTVREKDGLALSSRNKYLSDEERRQATVLFRAVSEARKAIHAGERSHEEVVKRMKRIVAESRLADLQYAEVVNAFTLEPTHEFESGDEVVAAVAVYFGKTRLIDNVFTTIP